MAEATGLVDAALAHLRAVTDARLPAGCSPLGRPDRPTCRCETSVEGDRLVVDADRCPGAGDLAAVPACRATVIAALATRERSSVSVRSDGLERRYDGRAARLLRAAGRFADRIVVHDEWLADRCRRDPLAAGREAIDRAGPVGDAAATAGLAALVRDAPDYESVLRPRVAPAIAHSHVTSCPPSGARLRDGRDLSTGAVALVYAVEDRDLRLYHLRPTELDLAPARARLLDRAYRRLAAGQVPGDERAPQRAVRDAVDGGHDVERLGAILRKHTRGLGVLEDLLADERVSDVYATAPVQENPLRVVVDGEPMRSNVHLDADGAATLASRFRRESGRAFSSAEPTLDATTSTDSRGAIRVAGVTEPASDGVAFAFRATDDTPWTLPGLVANDTVPAAAGGLLSAAVRRGAAILVAGPRGAGKTTTLGALLWELPTGTRTIAIEDTRELPIRALQRHGRDVQGLATTTGEEAGLTPVEALRTALRLGDGALVLGEVRGEEAAALYEAMRVGASSHAVLGTIHGDGPAAVRERVTTDLGVPESAFGSTDLVVTLDRGGEAGDRRVARIDEVVHTGDGVAFESLFASADHATEATGRIERGRSRLLADLARPSERYADVRTAVDERAEALARLATTDRTRPADLTDVRGT